MATRKNHVGKLVFAKPMAGTVSRVSRANSEDDELTEDTGRLINAHMTAKGEDAAMRTVITASAEDAMPTVTIDNLDVNRLAVDFDRDPGFELHSGLELIKVAAAVRSSGRLKKLGRSASLPVGCSETRATQKRSWKERLGNFRVPGPGYRESNPVVRLLDKRPVQNVTTADVTKLIVMNDKTSALAQAGQQMRVGRVADETP